MAKFSPDEYRHEGNAAGNICTKTVKHYIAQQRK
jgi:hypothetical protein